MFQYRVRVSSAYASVGIARRAVVRFAGNWFSDEMLADIEHAVGEALANSAEHGSGAAGEIAVQVGFDGRRFVVEVKDEGRGFDRWDATGYVRPPPNSPRGYGTLIMRELMDEVEYSDHGRCLRLTKYVPAGRDG